MSEDLASDDANSGDTCWSAMKTVWNRVREHCGTGVSLELGPITLDVPVTVVHIASQEGSKSVICEAIIDTSWCKETAEKMYSSMSAFDHDSPSYFLGLANVEETIADAVIGKFGPI